jgi:hypothetical protein
LLAWWLSRFPGISDHEIALNPARRRWSCSTSTTPQQVEQIEAHLTEPMQDSRRRCRVEPIRPIEAG